MVWLGGVFLAQAAVAQSVVVPARANPWLAGMTNGAVARRGDSAPEQSPVLVTNVVIEGQATYAFTACGAVNHGAPLPFAGPDGEDIASHFLGAEHGMADLAAPFASLVGVFLGPDMPDEAAVPVALDFSSVTNRDYLELTPALQQPFFIGDGVTSSGVIQQVIAPQGATRLLFGVMDGYHWADNEGAFTVEVRRLYSSSPRETGRRLR